MVTASEWVPGAIEALKTRKIMHGNYETTRRRLTAGCAAVMKGELIVLVGPSRVGKTRCLRDALDFYSSEPDPNGHMRAVMVEAGNDSTGGEFSTKAFIAECLRAIRHPIYGMADEDDPWEARLQATLHRTPEGTLRAALQRAIGLRETVFFIIDEAHHVRYAPGGDAAAARILDSYKCLANRTNIKLILAGSYQLLDLLTLAPHLLGRQHPLEFPRYRAESRADVNSWQQILQTYSKYLLFEPGVSLCTWNSYLFEGSQGCVGQLLRWLRAALAKLLSEGDSILTQETLVETRAPATQEDAILAEILHGEEHLIRITAGTKKTPVEPSKVGPSADRGAKKETRKRKPFQRASRRNKPGGRS